MLFIVWIVKLGGQIWVSSPSCFVIDISVLMFWVFFCYQALRLILSSLLDQTFSHVAHLLALQTEFLLLCHWLKSIWRGNMFPTNRAAEIDFMLIYPLTTFCVWIWPQYLFSFRASKIIHVEQWLGSHMCTANRGLRAHLLTTFPAAVCSPAGENRFLHDDAPSQFKLKPWIMFYEMNRCFACKTCIFNETESNRLP